MSRRKANEDPESRRHRHGRARQTIGVEAASGGGPNGGGEPGRVVDQTQVQGDRRTDCVRVDQQGVVCRREPGRQLNSHRRAPGCTRWPPYCDEVAVRSTICQWADWVFGFDVGRAAPQCLDQASEVSFLQRP